MQMVPYPALRIKYFQQPWLGKTKNATHFIKKTSINQGVTKLLEVKFEGLKKDLKF